MDSIIYLVDFFVSNLLFWLSRINLAPRIKHSGFNKFAYKKINFSYRPFSLDSIAIMENVICQVYTRGWFKYKPKQTFIDIGGHIGTFSITACHNSPNSTIYAYEPAADTFNLLLNNIKLNRLTTQIKSFNQAVYSGYTKIKLNKNNLNPGQNSITSVTGSQTQEVDCTTLDLIFKSNRISVCDLLKIDCEGAELEILKSTSPETFLKIQNICMEFHLNNESYLQIKQIFTKNGFFCWLFPGKHSVFRPLFGSPLIFAKRLPTYSQ